MAVPTIYELMLPVLRKHAEASGPLSVVDFSSVLADELGLSHEDVIEQIPSGGRSLFQSRLQGARHYLRLAGSLESPSRGKSVITSKGQDELKAWDGSRNAFISVSKRYPKALEVPGYGQMLQVRSKRSNLRWLSRSCYLGFQTRRAIVLVDGREAGEFELVQLKIQGWDRESLITEIADCTTKVPKSFEIMLEYWDQPQHIRHSGPIIEVRLARMGPAFSRRGLFAASVNALLASEYRNRSILIMKAWPLENEGGTDAAQFKLRQRAMVRYCARSFGALAFPGVRGDEGWMYAIPEHQVYRVKSPSD